METEMNLFLFNLNIWREFKWKVIMIFFSEYQKFRYMSEKLQPYSCSKLEVFWKEVFKASAKKNITRSEGDGTGSDAKKH